ncbi:MAG: SMC-Scp complex subunit ScpB [Thermodesulfovibrio sp.]|nr:SMC-Scp complex subunit ScpB [Thermodesulfovibrio sp.]
MHLFKKYEQIKRVIESLLFISEKPLSRKSIASLFNISESEIKSVLESLMKEYEEKESGILIVQIDESYQMVTNPKYSEWVILFKNMTLNNKLSDQAFEVLAIIAYKQPITKAEIEKIRGVNSDYAIKTLMDRKLVKITGKKEVPGRPFLYGTTKEFLKLFGISSLNELPKIDEFQQFNAA